MKDFLTIKEAANLVGLSDRTLWRYVMMGRFKAVDFSPPGSSKATWRIPRESLEAWLKEREQVTSDRIKGNIE